MDDPLTIVHGAIDNHVKMINEYKGVPGVQAGRLQEGYKVLDPLLQQLHPPPPAAPHSLLPSPPSSAALMRLVTPALNPVTLPVCLLTC